MPGDFGEGWGVVEGSFLEKLVKRLGHFQKNTDWQKRNTKAGAVAPTSPQARNAAAPEGTPPRRINYQKERIEAICPDDAK